MRRSWLAVALLLSLGVNVGLSAAVLLRARARPAPRSQPPAEVEPGRLLAEWLDLEGEQRVEFLAAQRRLAARAVAERREIARLRRELRAELLAETLDRSRLDTLLGELASRHAALDRAFVDGVVDSRHVLSDRALERYLRFVDRIGSSERGERERPRWRRFGVRRGEHPSGGARGADEAERP